METILSSLAFCGLALFLGIQRKISLLYTPFIMLSLLALVAYAGGYAHALPFIKRVFLYGGAVASLAALALCYVRRHDLWKDSIWKEEFCIFVGFVLLLLFYNWYYAGSHITTWDEFFHAAYVKALFYEHGFWTLASPLARSEVSMTYPPITSLLVWIFQPIKPYTEAAFGVSTMAFLLSVTCVLYSFARQQLSIYTSLLLVFVVTVFLRVTGASVAGYYLPGYVDNIQGGLFALALCTVFFLQKNKQRFIVLALGLLLLALCKSTGIVLCLYVSAALALQRLLQNSYLKKNILPACVWGCASFALALIPYICWKMYVKTHFPGIEQTGAMMDIVKYITDPLFGLALQAQLQAFYNQGLIRSPFGYFPHWTTSTSVFLAFMGLGVIWAQYKGRAWQSTFNWQLGLALCGLVAWVGLHFYAFFVYNTWDHIVVANSFNRYTGTFINGIWTVFLLLIFSYGMQKCWKKSVLGGISVILILLTFFPLERPAYAKKQQVALKMQILATHIAKHTPKNSLTLFVPNIPMQAAQNNFDLDIPIVTQHQEVWALRYYLAPERKAVYPYLHNYNELKKRYVSQVRPLPEKAIFLQDVKASKAQYVFINSKDVLLRYQGYFPCSAQNLPCLIPVQDLF